VTNAIATLDAKKKNRKILLRLKKQNPILTAS